MKTLISKSILVSGFMLSSVSQAAYLTATHLNNDSFANAQFIGDNYFDIKYDRDIQNSSSNPHASILGAGDESVDFFSFNGVLGQAYFDIDYGDNFGGDFDSRLELYDTSFNLLSVNDDYNLFDRGSSSVRDSFISYNLLSEDIYYIAVGRLSATSGGLSGVPFGANYTLHISRAGEAPSPIPIPAAVWLFATGLFGLVGVARRHA